ncbi:uncharacterized protein LOC110022171 [Phalaenopsis equestris]|uniref:uncharacterized protein LOC110022171 n=1 Tax=Phalaenopsis equestris TaxID=78828 RepID=UPI0009E56F0F|nr:uncharacterized protein LOC110022171 [Phalaenopsis equestris]
MENMNQKATTNKEQKKNPETAVENPMPDNLRKYDSSSKTEVNEACSNCKAKDACGDVNMEATISADDVARAGGFGARDDIGSFLPVAADSTDFEASLLDARDFEEPQGEKRRPGLGWTESMEIE